MLRQTIRNLLVGYGAYYGSWWVAYPFAFAYGKLTERVIYHGDFAGAVVMPLVRTVPYAMVAFGVGAFVAWLVDSERPLHWAIFPAVLYVFYGVIGYHWARQPSPLDRVAQVIDATFMGIACLGGAMLVVRRGAPSPHRDKFFPRLLELIAVLAGSMLAGVVIGTLQHYVSFGIWGYGFGKEALWLAGFEGGGVGGALGVPTGLLVYYVILKRQVTSRQIATIVLGSLVGGCIAGAVIFWSSVFVTPILTILLSLKVRVAPRLFPKSSTAP
jgi:hypothetical protein